MKQVEDCKVDVPELSSKTTATRHCVRSALLHCYAKASHHVSDIPGLFLRIVPRYHRSMSLFALTCVPRHYVT